MTNLYNVGDGKTKMVFDYLNGLKLSPEFSVLETQRFIVLINKARDLALRGKLNEALETIGYVDERVAPNIYHIVKSVEERK
jgi:hypothetical protein